MTSNQQALDLSGMFSALLRIQKERGHPKPDIEILVDAKTADMFRKYHARGLWYYYQSLKRRRNRLKRLARNGR